MNAVDSNEDTLMDNNEEFRRHLPIFDGSFHRYLRSSPFHPRANRNTWFRVSTYQHFKPAVSEEKSPGDNLLRWG
jgi:hypothetical protein